MMNGSLHLKSVASLLHKSLDVVQYVHGGNLVNTISLILITVNFGLV